MDVTLIKGDRFDPYEVDYRDGIPVNMFAINKKVLGAAGYMQQFYGISVMGQGSSFGISRGAIYAPVIKLKTMFRVMGDTLFRIILDPDSGQVSTQDLGTIPGTGQVSMTYSNNNLIIVADKKLFYFNYGDLLREITSGGVVGSPIDVTWIDGYVFLTNGKQIYHSTLADEEVFKIEDFQEPNFVPDEVVAIAKNDDDELVVWSNFSTQHYINVGTANFAFQNLARKTSKYGAMGPYCKMDLNGIYYMIGKREGTNPTFYIYSRGSTEIIASRQMEIELNKYDDADLFENASIDAFYSEGIEFVMFHLPKSCFLFNPEAAKTMGPEFAWSELTSNLADGSSVPYRGINIARDEIINELTCGDKYLDDNEGRFGQLRTDLATQYTNDTEWELYSPFLNLEGQSIDSMEIQTIPGVQKYIPDLLNPEPDPRQRMPETPDPKVFVSITQDGRIYGTEWIELYGKKYDYNIRFIIRRLGYVRHWIGFKFRGYSGSRVAFGLMSIKSK